MRKKIEKIFWDMEIIGNRRKIYIFTKIKNGLIKKNFYFLGEVRMFHPARKVCFHEWRPVDKKNIAVNSIVFHSEVITNYS